MNIQSVKEKESSKSQKEASLNVNRKNKDLSKNIGPYILGINKF